MSFGTWAQGQGYNTNPSLGNVRSTNTGNMGGPFSTDKKTGLPDLSYMYDGNKLGSDYTLGDNKYNTGQGFINQLSARANNKGPSAWAMMQNKAIDTQTGQMRDQATSDAANAYGGGLSNLAASGGFDAGSRERLASSAGLGRMSGLQNASLQGNMAKLGTGVQDEQMKLDIMKQLPGMQLQQGAFKAGLDQFDINNNLGMGKMIYGEGIKYQSGKELAEATAKAGNKPMKWYEKGVTNFGEGAGSWGSKTSDYFKDRLFLQEDNQNSLRTPWG